MFKLRFLLKYANMEVSAKTEHAGFPFACNHNLTLVSKAPVLSQSREVLADAQAGRRGSFIFMGKGPFKSIDFDQDQMCIRCGSWYIPDVFNDDGRCQRCRRVHRQATERLKINVEYLLNAWERISSEFIQPDNSTTFVYFIRGKTTGRVKVGFSSVSVWDRMNMFQTGSPDPLEVLGVVNAPFAVEHQLHLLLEPYHSHHEWFDGSRTLYRFIRAISYMPDKPSVSDKGIDA